MSAAAIKTMHSPPNTAISTATAVLSMNEANSSRAPLNFHSLSSYPSPNVGVSMESRGNNHNNNNASIINENNPLRMTISSASASIPNNPITPKDVTHDSNRSIVHSQSSSQVATLSTNHYHQFTGRESPSANNDKPVVLHYNVVPK